MGARIYGVLAEVSVRVAVGGYSWSVTWRDDCRGAVSDLSGVGAASPSEAVWSAVDELRDAWTADLVPGGTIAVYSLDGSSVAVCPLFAVPTYGLMPWVPVAADLEVQEALSCS